MAVGFSSLDRNHWDTRSMQDVFVRIGGSGRLCQLYATSNVPRLVALLGFRPYSRASMLEVATSEGLQQLQSPASTLRLESSTDASQPYAITSIVQVPTAG